MLLNIMCQSEKYIATQKLAVAQDTVTTIQDERTDTMVKNNVEFRRLQARYTFGNCYRPVSSLGVSQHMHQITNL